MKKRPLACICLAAFIAGFLLVQMKGESFVPELILSSLVQEFESGETVQITGEVYKKENRPDYQIIYLKNNSIRSTIITQKTKTIKEKNIIIYAKTGIAKIGNQVQAEGTLSFFEPARNPGNFDAKFYYQKQGIHACMFSDAVFIKDDKTNGFKESLFTVRSRWKEILYEAAGEEKGAVLSAMLLGEKADMNTDIKELYQAVGIGHILAISGLHLSLIGVGVYKLIRKAGGSFFISGVLGIFCLGIYICMIGLSVSAMRAVVMFIIRMGADMSGRVYDTPTALSVSAMAVIWWRPLSYYDSGFYLSFGAVVGVSIVLSVLCRSENKRKASETRGIRRWITNGFQAGLCIQLVTLPVILYCYYEIPVYSIFLNLLVIPLMSILLIAGIAGSLLYLIFPSVGFICILISKWILMLYEVAGRWLENLPVSGIICGRPQMWQIILYYTCLLMLVGLWKNKKFRKPLVIILCLSSLLLCVGHLFYIQETLLVTMVDVGQGDSIYVKESGGITCLIDGGSSDIKSVGKYRIEPYLKQEGTKALDYVFITHSDADHTNGIEELINRKERGVLIRNLVLPETKLWDKAMEKLAGTAVSKGIKIHTMSEGQSIRGKNLEVNCLYPRAGESSKTGNETSLVLELKYKEFRMLTTGDLEGDGEEIVAKKALLEGKKTEFLKVSHHGSRNSTSELFLEAVHPYVALISSGQKNRYGHPHEETLMRLKEREVSVYKTAERGAVMIETDGKTVKINTML